MRIEVKPFLFFALITTPITARDKFTEKIWPATRYKNLLVLPYLIYIISENTAQATENLHAGQIWPAEHGLDALVLEYKCFNETKTILQHKLCIEKLIMACLLITLVSKRALTVEARKTK